MKRNEGSEVVVVMVPFPAQGHLNQLLHLSRLILSYDVVSSVHYVSSVTHIRQACLRVHGWDPLSAAAANIHFHEVALPPFISLPPDPTARNKFPSHLQPLFDLSSAYLRHPVAELLRLLASKARKVIVVYDSMMGSVIQDVTCIPNAESYTFHSVSAFAYFLFVWKSIEKRHGDHPNWPDAIILTDIPSLDGCFTPEFFHYSAYQYEYQKFSHGRLYNTCKVIEAPYLDLLATGTSSCRFWALGPFNPVAIQEKNAGSTTHPRHFVSDWLDKQPQNSVVYVSFGTTTSMNDEQIKELAEGLKQSGQKFIWVLRDADKGDVFDKEGIRSVVEVPEGFEDSVRERGVVLREWAPQLEILAHEATGGFISHCGWNSCMESITMGVPIGAWPMHSDQPRNTMLITKVLKMGMVVREWEKREEVVKASVIAEGVRRLMASKEGDGVRKRAAELGGEVRRAAAEGGVSRMELDSFIAHITS